MMTRKESELVQKIAVRLKRARLNLGITQKELAARSGVHINCINTYENAHHKIPVTKLIDLAKALEVTSCSLLPE